MVTNDQNRVIFADILRIIAIFAVINIHVSGSFSIASFTATNINNWWVENIYNSFSRWSVPIFFMISGMFILGSTKEESFKEYFLKRFNKVIIPFFIWGIIYELIKPRYGFGLSFKGVINNFITGSIFWHFWFFYAIIMLYILAPIVKSFVSKASKEILIYTLVIWFLMASIIPLLQLVFNINFNVSIKISFIGSCVGYYILGYFLNKYELGKKFEFMSYVCAIISFIFTPLATYYLTKINGGIVNTFFYDYFAFNVVLQSIAIFLFFKSINWSKLLRKVKGSIRWITELSKSSFGIFVVHYIVLNELFRFGGIFDLYTTNSFYRVPITDIVVFIISFLLIFILRKIPIIKKIVP